MGRVEWSLVRSPRHTRFALGVILMGVLALAFSQAGRLPGSLGDTIRSNEDAELDATALFYTEVDGWQTWGRSAPPRLTEDAEPKAPDQRGGD